MSASQQLDAVVIGAGQGGSPLSAALARAGMRYRSYREKTYRWHLHQRGMYSHEDHGGKRTRCLSCAPRRRLWRSTGAISIDLKKIRQRKRDIVESFRNGSTARLEKTANLEIIYGDASFQDSNTMLVKLRDGGQRTLSAKHIFINAGTRASRPELAGLDSVSYLDNASIMELGSVPDHLLILGGGYIGLEFGQLFPAIRQSRHDCAIGWPVAHARRLGRCRRGHENSAAGWS